VVPSRYGGLQAITHLPLCAQRQALELLPLIRFDPEPVHKVGEARKNTLPSLSDAPRA